MAQIATNKLEVLVKDLQEQLQEVPDLVGEDKDDCLDGIRVSFKRCIRKSTTIHGESHSKTENLKIGFTQFTDG